MKKLLAFMGLAVVTASMMFANVEINPRLFGDFESIKTKEDLKIYKADLTVDYSFFGAEIEGNFWFAHPWILDIGLSTALDAGFGKGKTELSVTILNQKMSVSNTESAFTAGFSIAPAVQFNVGKKNSIFLAPGFRFALMNLKYTANDGRGNNTSSDKFLFSPEFTLDAGYKFWIFDSLALNAGYQLELPLGIYNGGDKYEIDSALGHRIYLGVCLNLGKRNAE